MKLGHIGTRIIFTLACLIGATMLLPQVGRAQDENVKAAMQLLESLAANLGQPKIEGSDKVAGKDVPADLFRFNQDE
jgi:hypothetical protein